MTGSDGGWMLEMVLADRNQEVEELAAERSDKPLTKPLAEGVRGGVFRGRIPNAFKRSNLGRE